MTLAFLNLKGAVRKSTSMDNKNAGAHGVTLAARGKSHAGGVTRPGADCLTRGRSRNAAPRSPRLFLRRPEAARNPSGDGHFFVPTAVMRARFFLRTRSRGADLAAHRDRAFSSQRPPRPSALSFAFSFARRRSPGSPSSSLRAFSSQRPQKPAALFPSYHGTFTTGCQVLSDPSAHYSTAASACSGSCVLPAGSTSSTSPSAARPSSSSSLSVGNSVRSLSPN